MLIAIDFKNGRIKEYDANAFTNVEAMRGRERGARNAMTEFDLRLDLVAKGEGLRLDYYWYDISSSTDNVVVADVLDENGEPVEMPRARRKRGTSIVLASAAELEQAARVIVYRASGSVQALWRQGAGDWLIMGSQFDAQRVLTYTDSRTTSLNAQSLAVYKYLRLQNPGMTEEEVGSIMGYPLGAIKEIGQGERAQDGLKPLKFDEEQPAGREARERADDWVYGADPYEELAADESALDELERNARK